MKCTAVALFLASAAVLAGCGSSGGKAMTGKSTPSASPTLDTYAVIACRHFHDAKTQLDAWLPTAYALNQSEQIGQIPGMIPMINAYKDGLTAIDRSITGLHSESSVRPYTDDEPVSMFIDRTHQWDSSCGQHGYVPGL